ncbi:MAG: flagellar brake protein [Cellvibrio sp.]|jgi:hypothetical protein
MKFEDLKLAYGYPLQLQINSSTGQPDRYSCRLIGCVPGRSVLLSVPRGGGKVLRFRAGQKVVVRMMIDNGIGLFAGTVETQTGEPYPILHLSYPEQVTFKGIRGATRVNVDLPVQVTNLSTINEAVVEGAVADISITGARMELLEAVGEIGDKIRISARVTVLDIVRELTVDAVIRSRLERSTQEADKDLPAVYGVEFIEDNEDMRLLLSAFVFSQMVNEH